MSDFSEYGKIAEDWERVYAATSQRELPDGLSALEQRRLTNDYRGAVSRKFAQSRGKNTSNDFSGRETWYQN